MRMLVIGGTGAMGVPLVKRLADLGNLVEITTRNAKNLDNSQKGVSYIIGDAHNLEFITQIIQNNRYEIIIDFMNYKTSEFMERVDLFLNHTDKYVFLSSARVYADSKQPISESSYRLLDVCKDTEYLNTDEYALSKAREENILLSSCKKNWLIVRPYITYNEERLQLGELEADYWIWRALKGKTIVLSKRTAEAVTTLTYGVDVSEIIVELALNNDSNGEIFQIANSSQSLTWKQILNIYLDIFAKVEGFKPKVKYIDEWEDVSIIRNNYYQFVYDRFLDRQFQSDKLEIMIGRKTNFTCIEEGLEKCLTLFLKNHRGSLSPHWEFEGYADYLTGDCTKISDIDGLKNKLKYILWKTIPRVMIIRKQFRRRIM